MSRKLTNRKLFREVNESIRGITAAFGGPNGSYELLCECESLSCTERVRVAAAEYERARLEGDRYFVLPGHDR